MSQKLDERVPKINFTKSQASTRQSVKDNIKTKTNRKQKNSNEVSGQMKLYLQQKNHFRDYDESQKKDK